VSLEEESDAGLDSLMTDFNYNQNRLQTTVLIGLIPQMNDAWERGALTPSSLQASPLAFDALGDVFQNENATIRFNTNQT
jgi:hypothetical protein